MEAGIGADFSSVRIHTGSHASQLNRSISAQAFTRGSDVFFDSGKYNPGSAGGKRLLAHELTHVVQQGGAAQGKSAQRKTTDIQRLRGVNEERDLPQVILATNILHQTVEKGRYQSLGSETVFENGLKKAKSALEPVPYIGLKSTTHDYFTAVGNMRDAAKRLSKKDDTLMDKEKEEGKWQKGISLWKRANFKRAANAQAVMKYRSQNWTSKAGKGLQKAMNFLVTGRKYKNSLDRAAWSYHAPLRSSPEFQKLEREYQAYKDAVEYANQGKASYVKKIEPSVFISIYANLIASSIYESAQPEVPWYQPTLYAEHRKAQKAVSEFMRDQDYKKG